MHSQYNVSAKQYKSSILIIKIRKISPPVNITAATTSTKHVHLLAYYGVDCFKITLNAMASSIVISKTSQESTR
jgi:predicted RNA-binding protein